MKHNDLPGMVAALERARDCELSAVVQTELAAVLREFDERAIASELTAALEEGALALRSVDTPSSSSSAQSVGSSAASGHLGGDQQLDIDEVDVSAIDAALQYADQLGYRSVAVQRLVQTARLVRQLRYGSCPQLVPRCGWWMVPVLVLLLVLVEMLVLVLVTVPVGVSTAQLICPLR